MADFGSPATANYTAPNGLETLGNLMSLKRKQQGLVQQQLEIQGQQQGLQGQAAQVQMTQQDARQKAAAGNFFQTFDVSKHIKDDGTLDLDSAMTSPELKATGSDAPDVIQKLVGIKNAQLSAKSTLASVNGTVRDQFRQTVGGLISDKDVQAGNETGKGKVKDAINAFTQSGGDDAARIAQAYSMPIENAPPKKLADVLKNIQLQAVSAGSQATTTAPTGPMVTGPGGDLKVVNTNPNAPQAVGSQVGQGAGQGIAPQVTGLPTGQVGVVAPGGKSVAPIPSAGPVNANPTAPQMAVATGQAKGVGERVEQAKAQANNTIQTQDALGRALHILDSGSAANTGVGFDMRKNVKNFLAGVGFDTKGADDTNSLVKNLARYEASRATAAGLGGTDAARELSHTGSPNTNIDNAALKGIVRQSLATEKAIADYASIQSKSADPQALIKNENDFRNIPNLIQGYEYGLTKSPQEANEFLEKHGLTKEDMKKTRSMIKDFGSR